MTLSCMPLGVPCTSGQITSHRSVAAIMFGSSAPEAVEAGRKLNRCLAGLVALVPASASSGKYIVLEERKTFLQQSTEMYVTCHDTHTIHVRTSIDSDSAVQVTIFDIASGTWTFGSSIPLGYAADHIALYRYKDKVGIIGGRGFFTDSFLRGPSAETSASRAVHFNRNSDAHLWYSPSTDSWEVRSPLPVPRAAVTAVAVENRVGNRTSILVLAGERYNENCGDVAVVAEEYDPENDVWFCHRCVRVEQFIDIR